MILTLRSLAIFQKLGWGYFFFSEVCTYLWLPSRLTFWFCAYSTRWDSRTTPARQEVTLNLLLFLLSSHAIRTSPAIFDLVHFSPGFIIIDSFPEDILMSVNIQILSFGALFCLYILSLYRILPSTLLLVSLAFANSLVCVPFTSSSSIFKHNRLQFKPFHAFIVSWSSYFSFPLTTFDSIFPFKPTFSRSFKTFLTNEFSIMTEVIPEPLTSW